MKIIKSTLLCFIAVFAFTQSAHANQNKAFELSIFAGARTSDSFDNDNDLEEDVEPISIDINNDTTYGLILAWDVDHTRQGELLFSHSAAEFDDNIVLNDYGISVSYLHLGGNVPLSDGLVPIYLSGGIGATYFSPDEKGFDSEIKASANLALSAKFTITEDSSMFINARVYATYIEGDSELFCSGGNCSFYNESDLWLQGEFTAGLTFRF